MTETTGILQTMLVWTGAVGAVLLCVTGVVLSCLSISGTWFVAAAAALAVVLRGDAFPGWGTVIVFVVLSVLVEAGEALAGAWGVSRRGGSKLAALAAVVGGIAGLFLGSVIPIPVVGSLVGMMIGGFALAFAVEAARLKKVEHAASIAWGTVLARLAVVLLKLAVTLGMIGWLIVGMIL